MTPSEKAFYKIDKVLNNLNYRDQLSDWELNFLNSCYRVSRRYGNFNLLSMKQKQTIYSITKRFNIDV